MFVKMLPRLHRTHLILMATFFLDLTCSFSVWADHHTVIMVIAQAQPGTTEAEREKEPPTATKKADPKKETITPVTPTQKNQPPSDKKRATTEVEKEKEPPTAKKKAGSQKEIIAPVKPTQKGQPPTVKKKAGARRTAPIDHSTISAGQIIVKGHVRTAQGKPLADAIVTRESPKPTPRDFLTGADPGWDARKDAQPPPFDTSDDDGSFAVRLQGEPGMLPVSDAPMKDMIVTLDTRERYIALLKPGITPTDFVNDHGLQDVRIISAPSTGGSLVTYSVPSDQKKVKDLQDAISKDKRVASSESDNCREIQPNGGSETYPLADTTMRVGKECETTTVALQQPCNCDQLEAEARAAQVIADKARADAMSAKAAFDKAKAAGDVANQDTAVAQATVKGFARFFDESSWISGDRGRITMGDVRLLRDANERAWQQYRSGRLTAKELDKAWGENDASRLGDLRKAKQAELEEAKNKVSDASKKVQVTQKAVDEASRKATEAQTVADSAQTRADAARKAYEDCAKRCAQEEKERVSPPPPTHEEPSGTESQDVKEQSAAERRKRKCDEIEAEFRRLLSLLSAVHNSNLEHQRAARDAFWGNRNDANKMGYKSYLTQAGITQAQVAASYELGKIYLKALQAFIGIAGAPASAGYEVVAKEVLKNVGDEIAKHAGTLGVGATESLVKTKWKDSLSSVGDVVGNEVLDRGMDMAKSLNVEAASRKQVEAAMKAYAEFVAHAVQANIAVEAAQQLYEDLDKLKAKAEEYGCPIPPIPCYRWYKYGLEEYGVGSTVQEGGEPFGLLEGVGLELVSTQGGFAPRRKGPFLYRGSLGPCPKYVQWYRMFYYRWDDLDPNNTPPTESSEP